MVDYSKYKLSDECLQFIQDLHEVEEGQSFANLIYQDEVPFLIEMGDSKVNVFIENQELTFDTMDDMILNLKIKGKTFIELIEDIGYNE